MASLTRWTWIWVNSGSWWWTGRPGMLRFMGSQRIRHDWTTDLNWILENPMDGGAWWAAVHGVAKSRTRLSDFTFTFHFHALEKEMATHSSVLAWRIPGMGEPGGLPSMGWHRVGHNWSNLAVAAAILIIYFSDNKEECVARQLSSTNMSLLKPMNQGVILTSRSWLFKTSTFCKAIAAVYRDSSDGFRQGQLEVSWKGFSILDAMKNIHHSWEEIKILTFSGILEVYYYAPGGSWGIQRFSEGSNCRCGRNSKKSRIRSGAWTRDCIAANLMMKLSLMRSCFLWWAKKVVSWDEIYQCKCCEDCLNDNKGLRIYYINLVE